MIRILITGATGFIGDHLARYLIQNGFSGESAEIFTLVRSPKRLAPDLREATTVITGQLTDLPHMKDIVHSCSYIFHLAAEASVAGGKASYQNNVDGTIALLNASKDSPLLKRLVFTSSIGAIDRLPNDRCEKLLDETTPHHPLTQYGASKWVCEEFVGSSGVPYTIVRPTWVYGPGMRLNSHIRTFIHWVNIGNPIVHFNFPGRVSIIYISDLVEALIFAAQHPATKNEVYFASDGLPVSIGALFQKIGEFLGRRCAKIRFPDAIVRAMRLVRSKLPFAAQNLFSDLLCASHQKLLGLGFSPKVTLDVGLLHTVHDHMKRGSHPDGSNKICLITGAAGGLGHALAIQLYANGNDLLLIDKNEEELVQISHTLNARLIQADLCQQSEWERIRLFLEEQNLKLSWAINCAGIGARGRFVDLDFDIQKGVIDLNITALVYLTHLALSHFQKEGRGILVNIASSAAFQPLPYMAVYAASKAFVLSFTEAIWGEMLEHPLIKIIAVCPGGMATGFQKNAGVKRLPDEKLLAPDEVARIILKSARRNRSLTVLIGNNAKKMALASRLISRRRLVLVWEKLMEKLR